MSSITKVSTRDARYTLPSGAGSDAVHRDPVYSYAITLLEDSAGRVGSGLAFTLGAGNDLVCRAAEFYAQRLLGREIEEIMADFGRLQREMADEQQFRWLGPHKGIVHLALASVTNACWDLWAKTRHVPLWRLLLDLAPEQLVATLDLSYLEDELTAEQAHAMIAEAAPSRAQRDEHFDIGLSWLRYFGRLVLLQRL